MDASIWPQNQLTPEQLLDAENAFAQLQYLEGLPLAIPEGETPPMPEADEVGRVIAERMRIFQTYVASLGAGIVLSLTNGQAAWGEMGDPLTQAQIQNMVQRLRLYIASTKSMYCKYKNMA